MAVQKFFTPYQATKVMNAYRAQLGLTPVQSPMLYIQARKGKFPIEQMWDGRKMVKVIVDVDKFLRWVYEHNNRQAARRSSAQGYQDFERLAIEASK